MKKTKKIVMMSILAICLIITLSVTAFAAEKITDSNICNLTVGFQETPSGGDPDYAKEGVTVKLYKVCSLTDLGDIEVTSDFSGLEISTDSNSSEVLEKAIGCLTSQTNVSYSTETDASYKAEFTNIERGIYLVYVDSYTNKGKEFNIGKALVMIPSETEGNTWDYNVEVHLKGGETVKQKYTVNIEWKNDSELDRPDSVHVKFNNNSFNTESDVLISNGWYAEVMLTTDTWLTSNVVPDAISGYDYVVSISGQQITITYTAKDKPVPPPEKKDTVVIEIGPMEDEEIPNTGLLWWPVTVLAVAGVLFVSYGLIRRKHRNEE